MVDVKIIYTNLQTHDKRNRKKIQSRRVQNAFYDKFTRFFFHPFGKQHRVVGFRRSVCDFRSKFVCTQIGTENEIPRNPVGRDNDGCAIKKQTIRGHLILLAVRALINDVFV